MKSNYLFDDGIQDRMEVTEILKFISHDIFTQSTQKNNKITIHSVNKPKMALISSKYGEGKSDLIKSLGERLKKISNLEFFGNNIYSQNYSMPF